MPVLAMMAIMAMMAMMAMKMVMMMAEIRIIMMMMAMIQQCVIDVTWVRGNQEGSRGIKRDQENGDDEGGEGDSRMLTACY